MEFWVLGCLFVSRASNNYCKPGGWLKTTAAYSPTALEARSLKAGCQQNFAPTKVWGETLLFFWPVVALTLLFASLFLHGPVASCLPGVSTCGIWTFVI